MSASLATRKPVMPSVTGDPLPPPRRRRRWPAIGRHAVCLAISLGLFALPMLYLCVQAFKPYPEFLRHPTALPSHWTLSNLSSAWRQGDFGRELVNSLVYAIVPNVVTLILGVFLAFPISRGYMRGANFLYAFFIFSGFLPGALIPLFVEAKNLGLYNNMPGFVILHSLAGAGFFFFVGYIKTIPRELDEAAALDGCGYVRFIFTIIMPEMRPALATFGVFGFVYAWNSLIMPLVMLADSRLWPVTLGLYSFLGEHSSNWPMVAAGTLIVALPIVIVFVLLQRHLVEGVAGGAMAGSRGITSTPDTDLLADR
jgi:raffinose/stachyose/melibiose transport system permease protein